MARVVQELCTSNRSWKAPPLEKLPDPDQLSAKLTELEVDGEALLTYEDAVGSLKELFEELKIKKVPHQLSIRKAIRQFQARSPEYQRWKKANSGEQSDDSDLDEKPKPELRDNTDVSVPDRGAAAALSPASPGVQLSEENGQRLPLSPAAGQSSLLDDKAEDSTRLTPAAEVGLPTITDKSHPSPEEHLDQPPKKKQRIAPALLTTIPSGTTFNLIPTEADILVRAEPSIASSHKDSRTTSRFTYLGSRGFTFGDMLSSDMSTGQEDSVTQFSFVNTGSDYPGRRLQVNRAMKKFLLRQSASEVPGTASDDSSDQLLPLFGESDDEYDAETWREYEEEEAEREQLEALKKTFLSQDEIDDIIQQAIMSYEDDWNQKKEAKRAFEGQ